MICTFACVKVSFIHEVLVCRYLDVYLLAGRMNELYIDIYEYDPLDPAWVMAKFFMKQILYQWVSVSHPVRWILVN